MTKRKTAQVNISCNSELAIAIDRLADDTNNTRSDVIRSILQRELHKLGYVATPTHNQPKIGRPRLTRTFVEPPKPIEPPKPLYSAGSFVQCPTCARNVLVNKTMRLRTHRDKNNQPCHNTKLPVC